jgi:hypothetical protein
MTDAMILQYHDAAVLPRARVELAIVRRLLRALTKANYALSVDDGADELYAKTEGDMLALLFNLDDAHLIVRDPIGGQSFVRLVFGNDGYDVISDYGISLSDIIEPIEDWIIRTYEKAA